MIERISSNCALHYKWDYNNNARGGVRSLVPILIKQWIELIKKFQLNFISKFKFSFKSNGKILKEFKYHYNGYMLREMFDSR